MTEAARVLVVEDDPNQRQLMAQILDAVGMRVLVAARVEEAFTVLERTTVDCIVSDGRLPDADGLVLLEHIRRRAPDTGFVLITGHGTVARAVDAIRAGADDYLCKPFEATALRLAVERSLNARRLQRECRTMRAELGEREGLVELIGRSAPMQSLFTRVRKLAPTDATVVITGESGTGKELAARALHALSPRAQGPFIAVNCAAIPEGLAEAEFFGARRGAYAGSSEHRPGKFAAAAGGTLFLDEVSELPLSMQPKLLRALQERKFTPVGADQEEQADLRIIVATNVDLAEAVRKQNFRKDLYYRLSVVAINMPALREHPEDIPALVEHFATSFARRHGIAKPRIPAKVMRKLLNHSWPGNVRELANAIEGLVILAEEGDVGDLEFEQHVPQLQPSQQPASMANYRLPASGIRWNELERSCIHQAMELAGGNRSQAARLLGLSYKAFLYRLDRVHREAANAREQTERSQLAT